MLAVSASSTHNPQEQTSNSAFSVCMGKKMDENGEAPYSSIGHYL